VKAGLAGNEAVMASTFKVAYDSVLPAWQWFLPHTRGKPFVLVGDSQGSAVLIHLISAELDHEPAVLSRLLVAVLVGGNLQVPSGKTVGATFTKVPLCTSGTETGCAIAFSSYPSEPPADAVFARPGQGTSLQSGETAKAGQQVACTNPAALAGGTADLAPYFLTLTQLSSDQYLNFGLKKPVPTPWVTYPDLYSARCEQGGGATWLEVRSLAGPSQVRPVVNEKVVGDFRRYGGGSGPAWGYHSFEYGLTLATSSKTSPARRPRGSRPTDAPAGRPRCLENLCRYVALKNRPVAVPRRKVSESSTSTPASASSPASLEASTNPQCAIGPCACDHRTKIGNLGRAC
jgi:Protein of unknown function (DUF3089)